MYRTKGYTRYEELLEDKTIDAVVIAVPNYQHAEYTCRAAERGLHVLCEKPMATSVEGAAKMITVCRHRQVKLMIGNMVRFHPCHQWAKDCIERGLLGDITAVRSTREFYLPPGGWHFVPEMSGGGAIIDVAIHHFHLFRYILGKKITQVSALVNTGPYPFPIDITSTVAMKLEDYIIGTSHVSFENKTATSGLEICGTEGHIVAEGTLGAVFRAKAILSIAKEQLTKEWPVTDPFMREIEQFVQCITKDEEPTTNGEEGMRDLKVCLAAYRSAQEKHVIEVC